MAVKEVKMYTIVCDGCNKNVGEGSEFSAWNEVWWVKEIASESNWIELNGNDYCPNCWGWDESEENQIPKNK